MALNPFDVMRATRVLAPQDGKLNDVRWLIGATLQRIRDRAAGDGLQAADPSRIAAGGPATPQAELVMRARDTLQRCETTSGPAAWPIVTWIVLEARDVRACRELISEIVTPWRADAVICDRLRVALDRMGPLLGVTGP